MDKALKWGWVSEHDDEEETHGPFDSRKAALVDAKRVLEEQELEGVVEVDLGRCTYPDPTEHMPDDLDALLQDMDEDANSNDDHWENAYHRLDDTIFEVEDRDAAQKELTELLSGWAKKHVTKGAYWYLEIVESTIVFCRRKHTEDTHEFRICKLRSSNE